MKPQKKTKGKRGENTQKNHQTSRICPHCGQAQAGAAGALRRKPTGLARRRAKRSELLEAAALSAGEARVAPDPIDPLTVINGVVARIPDALGGAELGQSSAASVNKAIRKAVLDEFRTRAQFAGRMVEIDALLGSQDGFDGGSIVEVAMMAHLRELRISKVTEPEESDRFVVTEGEGAAFELLRPAYVDELTGKVILAGQLRRVPGPEESDPGEGR